MASTRINLVRGLMLAVMAVGLALCIGSTPLAAQDAAALYKGKCATCHGADGKGNSPVGKSLGVHDLGSPEVQKLTDAELTAIITGGRKKMPAYKTLKEADVKGLVAYIRDLGKAKK